MRALLLLVFAIALGLAGGWAWSKYSAHPRELAAAQAAAATAPRKTVSEVEQSVYFPDCAAATAAGKAPMQQSQPGYRAELDPDGDGIACPPIAGS
jgi:hypothetical protein